LGDSAKFFRRQATEPQQATTSKISRFTVGAIEALEAYSADHAEKLEELLDWDAVRFQTFYAAFLKRKAAEEIERMKVALTTGIWANSNYDSEKQDNPRQKFIEALEDDVQKKIATIYGYSVEPEEYEIDAEDPFWAAMYRGLEKQHGTAKPTKEEVERAIADMTTGGLGSVEVDQMD
jgi:hypothetical protein